MPRQSGVLPWPYSRDPRSPNRPPYLPQPPIVVRQVPTPLGPKPVASRATMLTFPFPESRSPYRIVPNTGTPFMDALNIYNGLPTMREQRQPGSPTARARNWPTGGYR